MGRVGCMQGSFSSRTQFLADSSPLYSIGLWTCKISPLHLFRAKSLSGCGAALVWSAILYRVPRVGHCGDGVPRVSFLEEGSLACSLNRPLPGRGLSSCLGPWVATRPVRSRKGRIQCLVGHCPCLVCQRFRSHRRTEYLRDKLGR